MKYGIVLSALLFALIGLDAGAVELDYSSCGYRNSDEPIPDVGNVIFVPWKAGDNTERIQRAIDYASSLAPGPDGFRGAVLLDAGVFDLCGSLRISASGVILRGGGEMATALRKQGIDRGSLIYVEGEHNPRTLDTLAVNTVYLPLNTTRLPVACAASFHSGDRVFIFRPSTAEWIDALGCAEFGGGVGTLGWKPGDIDLLWDRRVTEVSADAITLDAPLTMALDGKWGGASVIPYVWPGRIADVGEENLRLDSARDEENPKDENHCWNGISIADAENCWVRKVAFRHFAGSAVVVQPSASKITVEDCISEEPVSEIGGMRRCTFLTYGQQVLFQRCFSLRGIHDFAAGCLAPGPNAFVQCEAEEALGFSGAIDAWAPGLLFDVVNIDGHNLSFKNLGSENNGAGWNTGNSLFWQCTASEIENFSPAPDATNAAYGCWGQFSGDGLWDRSNTHIRPWSLFYAQLAERLGRRIDPSRSRLLHVPTNATSSPTVAEAMQLSRAARTPRQTMKEWIAHTPFTAPTAAAGLKSVDALKPAAPVAATPVHRYEIANGRMLLDGAVMIGGIMDVPWWSGKLRAGHLRKARPHLTRFVPGREGRGLTDRIDSTLAYMVANGITVLDHNYGLWYDRRRDDHERVRRRDGNVWAPFYEQPFARSGRGTAWDGLSKYDLTKPDAWYWSRLSEFARKGAGLGKLLFNEHYFQHNILEAGAHWVDCPWRPVNNINGTGFPEPVPFAGDKRVFMAEQFYDVDHPARRELHRNFIRMNLDAFADDPDVVHLIGAEFTGPLHFVQFWLDVIGAWQEEKGKDVRVMLSVTKDVQDAILADPKYARLIDIIDVRYWQYTTDGIYAPEGGKNLSPRQHARKLPVGTTTFEEVYKAVEEYRAAYPDKAVTYYAKGYDEAPWAVFMAGGSLAGIPVTDAAFLTAAAGMSVIETGTDGVKILGGADGCIVYSRGGCDIPFRLAPGRYRVTEFDPRTGARRLLAKNLKIEGAYLLESAVRDPRVYWFCLCP